MRLTCAIPSSVTSTFKLLETAANRLQVASLQEDADTAEFLFQKMDVEAASFEKENALKRASKLIKAELENRSVLCKVYRFQQDGIFGGYTMSLSALSENGKAVGSAFLHLRPSGPVSAISASLFYKSPYKTKQYTSYSPEKLWAALANLGYDKPNVDLRQKDLSSFIEREDIHGTAKCIDLKEGASFEIADRIRKTLARAYARTKVVESNSRYTVIADKPK